MAMLSSKAIYEICPGYGFRLGDESIKFCHNRGKSFLN